MNFHPPLLPGTLLRRYQRFLADIDLPDGRRIVAHVANTGAMTGCATPGSPVYLSYHEGTARKYPYSLELVKVGEHFVGVNTSLPNLLVEEAIRASSIPSLRGYETLRREVPYGHKSRIDLLLEGGRGTCYLEVKNVTLRVGDEAAFPDAVTDRGRKHLLELAEVAHSGARAVMLFLVNRGDCNAMRPADEIDPLYGRVLREVAPQGVELMAWRSSVTPCGIWLEKEIPVLL